jgi:hypothetical protein
MLRIAASFQGKCLLLLGRQQPVYTSGLGLSLLQALHCIGLPPFARWTVFPSSDYYGGSVPLMAYGLRLPYPIGVAIRGSQVHIGIVIVLL